MITIMIIMSIMEQMSITKLITSLSRVTSGYDYAHPTATYAVGALHANTFCLKIVIIAAINGSCEGK
jgi:hypothetical protein